MKKIALLFALLISISGFSQIAYKNIQVNEPVHYVGGMGDSINSCYIVITRVAIDNLIEFKAVYDYSVYKNKTAWETNVLWNIKVNEITSRFITFSPEFAEGDLIIMISKELIYKLLEDNPTWREENLIIEQ